MAMDDENQTSVDVGTSSDIDSAESNSSPSSDAANASNNEPSEGVVSDNSNVPSDGNWIKEGMSNSRTYDGRGGALNSLARKTDGLSRGLNGVGNGLNSAGKALNKYANKNPNTRIGKTAGAVGKKMGSVGNKVGGVASKVSNANKKVQMANNINNIRQDPELAKEMAVNTAKTVVVDKAKSVVVKKSLALMGSVVSAIGCFPLLIILVIVACFGVIVAWLSFDGGGAGEISYDSDCNFEETMVTVMDGNNEEVLATISLEDYVIGVACPEIGACSGNIAKMNKEYLKAKYVAVKTYTLTRRTGYNSSTKTLTMKAATKDQMWCDLEKGCFLTKTDHLVEGTSSVYRYSYPGDYDKNKADGEIYSNLSFTEEDLELAHKYYDEIYGDLFLPTSYNSSITKLSGEDVILSYHDTTQQFWSSQANAGKSYDEILISTANSGDQDASHYVGKSIYKMGNYCQATGGGSGDLVDLGNYPDVTSTKEINKQITSLLSNQQISEINNYIISNVDKAGYGTGAGVAAAGQSLIAALYQKGYYLPYYYGGGHASGIKIGVDSNWGRSAFDSWKSYNLGHDRLIYSYDCSGFVSWSIKNACNSDFSAVDSGTFSGYGTGISLSNSKPGDLMVKAGSHVRLIVKNNGNGTVIAAESTSGRAKHGGIQFAEYSSASGYKIVDMSSWYSKNCKKSR